MKKLLLVTALAGGLAVAFGTMTSDSKKKSAEKKTEKKCSYRSSCLQSI